jgi:hypothetical protein
MRAAAVAGGGLELVLHLLDNSVHSVPSYDALANLAAPLKCMHALAACSTAADWQCYQLVKQPRGSYKQGGPAIN